MIERKEEWGSYFQFASAGMQSISFLGRKERKNGFGVFNNYIREKKIRHSNNGQDKAITTLGE